MHKLYQLKEELMEELESYAGEEKSVEHAMHIKYLASAIDHICNICKDCEAGEYEDGSSQRMSWRASRRSYESGRGMLDGGERYDVERGRAEAHSGDSNSTRRKLEKMAETADERTRRAINQAIQML